MCVCEFSMNIVSVPMDAGSPGESQERLNSMESTVCGKSVHVRLPAHWSFKGLQACWSYK